MSSFVSLMAYIHFKNKEVGKPLTIKEIVKYARKWPQSKIARLVRKGYKMGLLGRIRVSSEHNARYSYGYYTTDKYEDFRKTFVQRKLTQEQLKNVHPELRDVLK